MNEDIWRILALTAVGLIVSGITFWLSYARYLLTADRVREIVEVEVNKQQRPIEIQHAVSIADLQVKVARLETSFEGMVKRLDEAVCRLERVLAGHTP